MWSFPMRISSSCLPTMFFLGQFVSSSLSDTHSVSQARGTLHMPASHDSLRDLARLDDALDLLHDDGPDPHWQTPRLASDTVLLPMDIRHPTPTVQTQGKKRYKTVLTLFADQAVVPIVGVVRIAQPPVRVLKLQKLVAVLSRVSCAIPAVSLPRHFLLTYRGENDSLVSERGA